MSIYCRSFLASNEGGKRKNSVWVEICKCTACYKSNVNKMKPFFDNFLHTFSWCYFVECFTWCFDFYKSTSYSFQTTVIFLIWLLYFCTVKRTSQLIIIFSIYEIHSSKCNKIPWSFISIQICIKTVYLLLKLSV